MNWLIENKEWILSGIGVFILGLIITFFRKKNADKTQNIQSGENSHNYQSGGDMNINTNKDAKEE